jgi:serine/threonine protein kinase
MNTQTDNNIIITNSIISKLIEKLDDKMINNIEYKYIGKGGEGVIFLCKGKIIKIYTQYDINSVLKEFYVVGLLQELVDISKNIIKINRYYLSTSHPVLIMEYMDGNLAEWCDEIVHNPNNLNKTDLDNTWLSMIFQVTYGLMFLNKLKILHTDSKSKNILYSKTNSADSYNYQINVRSDESKNIISFNVPLCGYIFKIADFGAIQILGSTLNRISDEEIKERLNNRSDLHELSRIWYRILVNYARNDYSWTQINPILESNKKYREYHEEQKQNHNKTLGHLPPRVREVLILRSLIYYGIENGFISELDIIKKYNLVKPSETVTTVLDGLMNTNVKNVFELFTMFKK